MNFNKGTDQLKKQIERQTNKTDRQTDDHQKDI